MEATDLINKFGGWTESYWFYENSDSPIELRYDPKDHVYLLVTDTGELEAQNGVTNVCHIIDKSPALVPWGCKMMAQKFLSTIPPFYNSEGEKYVFTYGELEKLILDAKAAHKEKLEDAGAVGHIAHNWIETYIKLTLAGDKEGRLKHRQEMPKDSRAQKACEAGLDWMKQHNVRWRATERKIYSRHYKYAGTMDGLCICDSCQDPKCCANPFTDRLTVADWKTSNYLYMEYLFQTAAYQRAYIEETGENVLDRWIIRLGKEDGEFEAWHREAHTIGMDFEGFKLALDLTRHVRAVELNLQARAQALRAAIKAEKDAARAAKTLVEEEKKALAKAEKQQARLEALAKECPKAKKYKGMKAPKCGPCAACSEIYEAAQALRAVKNKPKFKEPKPVVKDNTSKINSLLEVLGGTKTENLALMVVPKEAPVRCDGEHGEPACESSGCWQGEVPTPVLEQIELTFVCYPPFPVHLRRVREVQRLLTAGEPVIDRWFRHAY